MPKPKILIVDDETDILKMLEYNLAQQGFKIYTATNGEDGIDLTQKHQPDLILLDIMLPQIDGVETCRLIRKLPEGKNPYIVFLTARAEEYSEIAGLEAGADDYISKPIKIRLLVSRINAIFRRPRGGDEKEVTQGNIEVGDLMIVPDQYLVYKKGKEIQLPKKEFELLSFLAARPGRVFSRDALLENVWGQDANVVDRTVDVHVRKLREKIGDKCIQTIKGVGYKFISKK